MKSLEKTELKKSRLAVCGLGKDGYHCLITMKRQGRSTSLLLRSISYFQNPNQKNSKSICYLFGGMALESCSESGIASVTVKLV